MEETMSNSWEVVEDNEPHVQYSSDGKGNWWKTVWEEQCPEFVGVIGKILKNGRDYRCQGVKGHKGVHWRYSASGWFEWDDNDEDPQEGGACGTTPPDHKTYKTPKKMSKHHWLSHKTTTKVEDPEKIAQLERGEYENGASIDRPVNFDEMDPENREELEDRIGIRKAEDRLFIITDPEGNDENTLAIVTSDPRNARSEIGNQDHGGMPYEDWERVLDKGEMKQIKSVEELPVYLHDCIPFLDSCQDEWHDYTCLEWCQMMDKDGFIHQDE